MEEVMRLPFSAVRQALRDRVQGARDPESFARSLGVHLLGKVHFYGVNRGMFGSEPWLVTLGDNVHVTAGVQFVTHDGGTLILRKEVPDLEWTAPIRVGDDVYFGINTIVLPGVTIGDRCIVAAGAVVTRDVPSNSVVGGVPARLISSVDDYLEKMKAKSLKIGHLPAAEKERRLREHFSQEEAP
jgi:acetyltransferase-like isoleucine patch superfamily enzyme